MGRLSSFMIGLIVFMVFMTAGLSVLMAELNERYTITGYDSDRFSVYNQLGEINKTTRDINKTAMALETKTGVTDVLGDFFGQAYNTLKVGAKSISLFHTLGTQAINDSQIADESGAIQSGIFMIVIIAVFLGIIISAVVKRDL